jgi:hypothetical protein
MSWQDWKLPGGGSARDERIQPMPQRRVPSTIDEVTAGLRARAAGAGKGVGGAAEFVDLHTLQSTRIDAPHFLGMQGRALICLHLSPELVENLDGVIHGLSKQPPNIHFTAYLRGGYPILRTVLLLPIPGQGPLMFESPLLLTNGDVQEFCVAATGPDETIELHINHTADERKVSVACLAHRVRNILGVAIDAVRKAPLPPDDAGAVQAVDRMAEDFPQFTDGLSADTVVILEPVRGVSGLVKVELSFSDPS